MIHTSSFDIFDTCLVRKCGTPTALFDLLADEVFSSPVSDEVKHGFILSRLQADYSNPNPKKNIKDIYSNLKFQHPSLLPTEQLIDKELQLERNMLSPVQSTLSLIETHREKGHHIIFISDMYLPSVFLHERLSDFGYWKDGDSIYVSNEVGMTKFDGRLYNHIAEKEKLDYRYWQHFGDNPHSDFSMPSSLGINSTLLHFDYSPYQKIWATHLPELQTRTGQLMAGLSRSVELSEPTYEQSRIVLDIIAPLLVSFVCRILTHASQHGIRHLFFCARDAKAAFLIAQRMEKIFPNVKSHYLYISQQALYEGDETSQIAYFTHIGLASQTMTSAIVDIRSTGKSLKYINDLFKRNNYQPIYGYFLEMFCNGKLSPNMPPYHCEIDFIYNRMNGNQLTQSLSTHWPLLEMFFSPHDDKKTGGYNIVDGVPQPFFAETSDGAECKILNIDQVISERNKLLTKYTDAFLALKLDKYADYCFHQIAIPTLAQFFTNPNRQYLKPLTTFYIRNEYSLKLEPYVEHLSILSFFKKKKGMAWRNASKIYSMPEWLIKLLSITK